MLDVQQRLFTRLERPGQGWDTHCRFVPMHSDKRATSSVPGCAGVIGASQGEEGVRLPGTPFCPSSLRSLRLTVTVLYCASSSMRQCVSVADATRPR